MNIDKLVEDFEQDAAIDYIGLWELVRVVAENIEDKTEENIRKGTIDLLRAMLSRGFKAGGFTPAKEWKLWLDQDTDTIICRIEADWDSLGRVPTVGEIVWFELKDAN
jgi:hypothetical protein